MDNQLIEYSGKYVEQIIDLKSILISEGRQFASLWEDIEYTNKAFYVMTASEKMLTRYEVMLGISVEAGETLESRRAKIVTRLNNREKMSKEYIQNIARAFEWGDIEIVLSGKKIKIIALSRYGVLPQHQVVAQVLREKLPAHISGEIIFKLWGYNEMEEEGVTYLFLQDFSHFEIQNRDIARANTQKQDFS